MQTEMVEIKSKGKVLKVEEYKAPTDLEEAFEVDGEEQVFKLYAQKRKSDFKTAELRKLTSRGVPRELLDKLRTMSREKLESMLERMEEAELEKATAPDTD